MAKVRRTSAQTRVKLSRAAKQRKRAPKGTLHAGEFAAGIHFAASRGPGKNPATGLPHSGQRRIRNKDKDIANRVSGLKTYMAHNPPDQRGSRDVLGTPAHQLGRTPKNTDPFKAYKDPSSPHYGMTDVVHEVFYGESPKKSTERKSPKIEHSPQELMQMSRAEARRAVLKDPYRSAEELARGRASKALGRELEPWETASAPLRVTSVDTKKVERDLRAGTWRREQAVYGQGPRKEFTPTSKFIKQEMPEEHRRWLVKQLEDPNSPFNQGLKPGQSKRAFVQSAGAGHRLDIYIRQLQQGASHADALEYIKQEHRGGGARPDSTRTKAAQLLGERGQARGRRTKYESGAPGSSQFKYGIEVPHVDTPETIRRRFPGLTEKEYIKIQQAQRETIFDTVDKNQRWTHERARAMYQGNRVLESHGPDRVTFFTTNVGGPAPSVPSDSLVGQYIVKRRKKVLRDAKIATPRELQGRFPEAVRDMHVIEAATGVSGGIQGRYGVFSKAGWRAGAKKSKNFGKPKPIGASVLYDNQGRPMYDTEGNIRYTEGITRPFDYGTNKDLGLRIFIG